MHIYSYFTNLLTARARWFLPCDCTVTLATRSTWHGQHVQGHDFKYQGHRQHFPKVHFSGGDIYQSMVCHQRPFRAHCTH